jgi:hypothetical protein
MRASTARIMDDGVVQGNLEPYRSDCTVCKTKAWGIRITGVKLPDKIKPSASFILFEEATEADPLRPTRSYFRAVSFIGINCGCYARAHRQIAHIQEKLKCENLQGIRKAERMKVLISLDLAFEGEESPSTTLENFVQYLPEALGERIQDFDPDKAKVAGYQIQVADVR